MLEFWADFAEFCEMASDMGFENLLAAVRIDLQFGASKSAVADLDHKRVRSREHPTSGQGSGARRPLHLGVAFAPGERKDR